MELNQRTDKAFKSALDDYDIISSMPDNVVTNILDRLPIQYAMRTSVLSTNWRFKWTMLTQLVFDENFFNYLTKTNRWGSFARILSMFILYHKGSITKFVLFRHSNCVTREDLDHWILFLYRKGIKDLVLEKKDTTVPITLPIRLFSCLELKHLKIVSCRFNPPARFHGFPNLLSLELCFVRFERDYKFEELFTLCPKLEILNMGCRLVGTGRQVPQGKVKLVDIAKLVNLKILSLSLCNLDTTTIKSISFEPTGFLPKLQELHLDFHTCAYTEVGAKNCLPTSISHLKTLTLSTINLEDASMLSCAFETIRSFPNLQTLKITTHNLGTNPIPANLDYDTMDMLQLRSVVFAYCKCSDNEVCLIKYLLACSPFLKKMVLYPSSSYCQSYPYSNDNVKFKFSTKLLKLQRASLAVDIDLS